MKFDGNTEPVMVNVQGSDINQMAGEERIELSIMVLETTVIPLNYSPRKETAVSILGPRQKIVNSRYQFLKQKNKKPASILTEAGQ